MGVTMKKLGLMNLNLTKKGVVTRSPAMKELTKQNKSLAAQFMKTPDLKADDWMAVAFLRAWYPGQFIEYDDESSEVYANFLD